MPASLLRIQLFGLFCASVDGIEVPLPGSSDARRLLAYLLVQRKRQPRASLAGKLWPEQPEESARHALRQAIWRANQRFPGLIESLPETVGLAVAYPLETDLAQFEAIVRVHLRGELSTAEATRQLPEAIALYQGDLLDGYYDDWITYERERLRELYLQALESLVVSFKATLRYEQALTTALRLVSADPLRESAHQEVMRLYHYLGHSSLAIKQYQKCREIFKEELGLEPCPDTVTLAQAITRRMPAGAPPYLPEPGVEAGFEVCDRFAEDRLARAIPLIGRAVERDQLRHWFLQGPGSGPIVLVEGEAGVGKTRLLQEFARDAEWHGAKVIWGKAVPVETRGPYASFREAIESQLTPLRIEQLRCLLTPLWLHALLPVLPQLAMEGEPAQPLALLEAENSTLRLTEAVGRLLAALAQVTPLVLILEDLQWADEDTLAALPRLPRYLEGAQILLALSYRGEEVASAPALEAALRQLPAESMRGRIMLTPLSETETSQLLHAALGSGSTSSYFDRRMYEETRGNPLFGLEILRNLAAEKVLHQSSSGVWHTPYDGEVEDSILPLPLTLEQIILRRLEQLPEKLVRMLENLAVFGDRFSFAEAICVDGGSSADLACGLHDLVRRRILAESAQSFHFRHEKIRQIVYDGLPELRRRELHLRQARLLEKAFPDRADALGFHFYHGQAWDKAYRYAELAASRAEAAFAYQEALAQLDRALVAASRAEAPASGMYVLLLRREAILGILGRTAEQELSFESLETAARGDALKLSEVYRRKATWLANQSRYDEGEAFARRALELARQSGCKASQAAVLITLGEIVGGAFTGRLAETNELITAANELCARTQDLRLEAELRTCISQYLLNVGPQQIGEELRALAIYRELGDKASEAETLCEIGAAYQTGGNQQEAALQHYQEALEIARAIGYRKLEARLLNNMANIYIASQVKLALECYEQAAAILKANGDARRAAIAQLNAAQYRVLLLGDTAGARQVLPAIERYASQAKDLWIDGFAKLVRGQSAYQEGDLPAARALLVQSIEDFLITSTGWLHAQALIGLALVERDLNNLVGAERCLEAAEALARPSDWSEVLALILSVRASLRLKQEQLGEAEKFSDEAMNRWTSLSERAWITPFIHYQVLKAQGKQGEAQAALDKAHQAIERLVRLQPVEERQLCYTRVPDYRQIEAAWAETQAKVIVVRLPSHGAPRDGLVEVRWTLASPEDKEAGNKVALRRKRLTRLLAEAADQGVVPTYEHLAQALQVSPRTISTDMAALKRVNASHPARR